MKAVLITGACINTGVAIVEKFASEGQNVVFTGRKIEIVMEAESKYRAQFPNVEIIGYTIDSLLDERTVDEAAVEAMFATFATARCSTAPADALVTRGVKPTARRLGMTRPWAPQHSAQRMMAPKL